jgi:hypothetical protein
MASYDFPDFSLADIWTGKCLFILFYLKLDELQTIIYDIGLTVLGGIMSLIIHRWQAGSPFLSFSYHVAAVYY